MGVFGFGKGSANRSVFGEEREEISRVITTRTALETGIKYLSNADNPDNRTIRSMFYIALTHLEEAKKLDKNVEKVALRVRNYLSRGNEQRIIRTSEEFLKQLGFISKRLAHIEAAFNQNKLTRQMLISSLESEVGLLKRFEAELRGLAQFEKKA